MANINQFNVPNGQRVDRKALITVAEWVEDSGIVRELLGTRIESSSIEYNHDISQQTDIRGNNYTDINKSQPQQDFEPFTLIGGSRLAAFLNDKRRRNALAELSNFNVYVITQFIGNETAGYQTEKHTGCTIVYNSIGGDTKTEMPITVYFSNNIKNGKVDKIAPDFIFSETDVTPALTLSASSVSVVAGRSAGVTVSGAAGDIVATSSAGAVATVSVSNGSVVIQGVSAGTATISIVDDDNKTASISVTVTGSAPTTTTT